MNLNKHASKHLGHQIAEEPGGTKILFDEQNGCLEVSRLFGTTDGF